jgi:hypothetical protein
VGGDLVAIVLVIIFLVIGMITQGSDREKGCGWAIVACVAFLWFLIQLGISGDDAANIFLWIIGIGFIAFIIWGISKSIKNNSSNQTTNVDNTNQLKQNQNHYEFKESTTQKSITEEKNLEADKIVREVLENTKKDEEALILTEVIKNEENVNKKSELRENYQRLVNCIANYIQIKKSYEEEKSKCIEIIKLEEKSNENLYDKKIRAMVNEFQNCNSIDDIIKTYINNRRENDIFNPANLGLLRGYLVRNTSYKEKKHVSSNEIRKLVEEKSNNNNYSVKIYNREQLSITEKKEEIQINTSHKENTNDYFEFVVDIKEDDIASVYSPIKIQHEAKELLEPYKTFDEMRKLGNDNRYGYDKRDAKLFVKQAKFMKDFQDNYDTVVSFQDYAPTYMLMSDLQLRTYFTWRTKIKNEEYIDCNPSYLYLYINEIINNIGVKNSIDAIEKLFDLLRMYQKIDHQFKRNMTTWIKDYFVLNDFKHDFKTVITPYKSMGLFEEFSGIDANESVFEYYNRISNYKIRDSKFYSPDKMDDICHCFDMVIRKLQDYFKQSGVDFDHIINDKKTLVETWWSPFRGAIYNNGRLRKDKTVYISENEYYKYENSTWTSYKPDVNDFIGAEIVGYIIKRMEAKMRVITKFKFKLSPKRTTLISHLRFQLQYFNRKLDLKFLEEEELDRIIDDCVEENYGDTYNKQYNLKCAIIEKDSNVEKNQYLNRTEILLRQNHEENKELIEIGIISEHVEMDSIYDSEKIGMQDNTVDLSDGISRVEKQLEENSDGKKSLENLYEYKNYDFNQNIHEYINDLKDLRKDKIVYDEPNTNITRFKKSEQEYAEKLMKISQLETNLDEKSRQFSRFMNDKVSGDLRAIDFLCTGNSDYTKGYVVWMKLIDEGKLFFPLSSTYAIVVMHQIINRLIVKNPNWALIIMKDLWNHYYPDFQHEETLMWIKDFWVTYCNEVSYSEFNKMFKYQIEFQGDNIMDSIDSIDVSYLSKNRFLDFFNENCNYKIKTGKIVQEGHENTLELCLGETITRLQLLFNEHELKLEDFFQICDEEETEKLRDPFRRGILTNQTKNYIASNVNDRAVGNYEKYNVVTPNGKDIKFLIKRKRYTYYESRLFIEDIGKICELYLRDWLGISANFIVNMEELCEVIPGLNYFENNDHNEIIEKIREAVEFICKSNEVPKSKKAKMDIKYLRDNKTRSKKNDDIKKDDDVKKNENQHFKIDVSRLDKIRNDAELIQERLIVENKDSFQEETDVIQELEMSQVKKQSSSLQNDENDEWQELVERLSSYELQTLSIILNQTDTNPKLEELSKKSGTLIEVMIEGINEKALEIIGDNLIESREDVPGIYQDYISDIDKLLQEEK